jgi:dihydroorotase
MKQGFKPDVISTDLHTQSMNGGMKDFTNVMSKFINMGMSVQDAVLRSTWNPASVIHRPDLGHLSVGTEADVTILNLRKGDFGFTDVRGAKLKGTQKLEAELTIRAGKIVWDPDGFERTCDSAGVVHDKPAACIGTGTRSIVEEWSCDRS